MADLRITGIRDIDRRLRRLEPALARKVLRQALRKAARPVAARTKQLAPVGDTGQTRRAVKVRASARTRRKVIRIRVLIGKGDYTGEQFYASFQEWGTKKTGSGRAGRLRRPGQRAQHFMMRALEQTRDQARRIAIAEIRAGIEREASR